MSQKVSVIVLNWNGRDDTIECLKSVYASGHGGYDVIVVDNGSTDGSVRAVRAAFPAALIIENEDNLGFAEGSNRGMAHAVESGAKYVMLLNNDAVIDKDALSLLAAEMERDEKIGAIGPLILYWGTDDNAWSSGMTIDRKRGLVKDAGLVRGRISGSHRVDALSACAIMLRASALKRCGYFDGKLFMYGEDTDLCVRLSRSGYSIACLPEARAWHKVGRAIGGSDSPAYMYYTTRNRLAFMKRYASFFDWAFFLPYFIYSSALKYARFLKNKRRDNGNAMLKGIRDFLFGKYGRFEEDIR
jgi:hypothetical protein